MSSQTVRRAFWGFCLTLAILCGLNVLSVSTMTGYQSDEADRRVRRALVESVRAVQANLLDAETGQRGYLAVGDPVFLEPYRGAVARHGTLLARMSGAARARGDGESRAHDRIVELSARKIAGMASTVSAHETSGPAAALAIMSTGEGRRTMGEIRELTAAVEEGEVQGLRAMDMLIDARARAVRRFLAAGTAGAFLVALTAYLLARSASKHEHRILAELAAARDNLETKVEERTGELTAANAALAAEAGNCAGAEARLRRQEDFLRRTLDGVHAFIGVLTREGVIIEVNSRALEAAGVPRDEVIGRPFAETPWWSYSEDARRRIHDAIVAAAAGATVRFDIDYLHADGTVAPVDFALAPMTDADGRITHLVASGFPISERKTAELARERALEQLEAVLDSVSDGVVMCELDGRFRGFNRAALAMHGFVDNDEARRHFLEYENLFDVRDTDGKPIKPDDWPIARALRGETLAGTLIRAGNRATGAWMTMSLAGGLVRDSDGQPFVAVLTLRDVTEERRAAAALRESEERFRLASEVASEAIYDWDLAVETARCSEAHEVLFGCPSDGDTLMEWWEGRVHPEDRPGTAAGRRASLEAGPDLWTAEYRYRRADDQAHAYVFDRAHIVRGADGRAVRVLGAMLDVTHREEAAAALKASHDFLEDTVRERTAELGRLNTMQRIISDCNQALVAITDEQELVETVCGMIHRAGYPATWVGYAGQDPEPGGAATLKTVACAGLEGDLCDLPAGPEGPGAEAVATSRTSRVDDLSLHGPDGKSHPWFHCVAALGTHCAVGLPLVFGGRAFGALVLFGTDPCAFVDEELAMLKELADDLAFGIHAVRARHERDHALRDLERRTAQLRALALELTQAEERERKRLAHVLHDHLQQLLVGARIHMSLLRVSPDPEALATAADRVDALLVEAFDTARNLTYELSAAVLHGDDFTQAVNWLAEWYMDKHGLHVSLHADPPEFRMEETTRITLFHALRELLFNSVKHSGTDRVEVCLRRDSDGAAVMEVEDQGTGFDPEASRATAAGAGSGPGGFGLFSLRERLDLLGGSFHVRSAPGQGSTFTVIVPPAPHPLTPSPDVIDETPPDGTETGALAPDTARRRLPGSPRRATSALNPGAEAAARAPKAASALRILIADDHPTLRDGLSRLLSDHADFEVVGQAADGGEAVTMARRLRPDLVLMDISMPVMNGIQATRQICSELPSTRIIGLSMFEDDQRVNAMLEAGASAFVNKGAPSGDLLAAIRKATDMPRPA